MEKVYSLIYFKDISVPNNTDISCIGLLNRPDSILLANSQGKYFLFDINLNETKPLRISEGVKLLVNNQRDEFCIWSKSFLGCRKITSDYQFFGGEVRASPNNTDVFFVDPLLSEKLPESILDKKNNLEGYSFKKSSLLEIQFSVNHLFPTNLQPIFNILHTTNLSDENLVINIQERAKILMNTEMLRWVTFGKWPHNYPFTKPKSLANTGFFDTLSFDRVNCFHCGTTLVGWEESDDPLTEHRRHFCHCEFIAPEKGSDFTWNITNVDFFLNRPFRQIEKPIKIIGSSHNSSLFLPTVLNDNTIVIWDVSSFMRIALEFSIDSYVPAKEFSITQINLLSLPTSNEAISMSDDEQFNNREKINQIGFPYLCSMIVETSEGFRLILLFKVHLNTLSNCIFLTQTISYYDLMKYHLSKTSLEKLSNKQLSDYIHMPNENIDLIPDFEYYDNVLIDQFNNPKIQDQSINPDPDPEKDSFLGNGEEYENYIDANEETESSMHSPVIPEVVTLLACEYIHEHGQHIDMHYKYVNSNTFEISPTCNDEKENSQDKITENAFLDDIQNYVQILLFSYGFCEKTQKNGFIKILKLSEKSLTTVFTIKIPSELTVKDVKKADISLAEQDESILFLANIEDTLKFIQFKQDENGKFSYSISQPLALNGLGETVKSFKFSSDYLFVESASGKFSLFKWTSGLSGSDIIYQSADTDLITELPRSLDKLSTQTSSLTRLSPNNLKLADFIEYLPRIFLASPLNHLNWSAHLNDKNNFMELIESFNFIDSKDESSSFKGPINHLNKLIAAESLSHVYLMKLAFQAFSRGSRLWGIPKKDVKIPNPYEDIKVTLKLIEAIPISCINVYFHLAEDLTSNDSVLIKITVHVQGTPNGESTFVKSIETKDYVNKPINLKLETPTLYNLCSGKNVNLEIHLENSTNTSKPALKMFRFFEINLHCFSGFIRNRSKYICNHELFLPFTMRCNENFSELVRQNILNSKQIQTDLCKTVAENTENHLVLIRIISWILNNHRALSDYTRLKEMMDLLGDHLEGIVDILMNETDQIKVLGICEFLTSLIGVEMFLSNGQGGRELGDSRFFSNFQEKYLFVVESKVLEKFKKNPISVISLEKFSSVINIFVKSLRPRISPTFINSYISLFHESLINSSLEQEISIDKVKPENLSEYDKYLLSVDYQKANVTLRSSHDIFQDTSDSLYYLRLKKLVPGRIFEIYIPMIDVKRIYRVIFKTSPFIVAIGLQLKFNQIKEHFVDFIIPDKNCLESSIDIRDWPYFSDQFFCGVHLIVAVNLDKLPTEFNMHLGKYFGVKMAESFNEDPMRHSSTLTTKEALPFCEQIILETIKPIKNDYHVYPERENLLNAFSNLENNNPIKMSMTETIHVLMRMFLKQDQNFLFPLLDMSIRDELILEKILSPILNESFSNSESALIIICGIIEYIQNQKEPISANFYDVLFKSLNDNNIFNPEFINEEKLEDLQENQVLQNLIFTIFNNMIVNLQENKIAHCNHSKLVFILELFPMIRHDFFDKLTILEGKEFYSNRAFFKVLFHKLIQIRDLKYSHHINLGTQGILYLDKCLSDYILNDTLDTLTILDTIFEIFSDEPKPDKYKLRVFHDNEIIDKVLGTFKEDSSLSDKALLQSVKYMDILVQLSHNEANSFSDELFNKCIPTWLEYLVTNKLRLQTESAANFFYPKYINILEFVFERLGKDFLQNLFSNIISSHLIGYNKDLLTIYLYYYSRFMIEGKLPLPNIRIENLTLCLTRIYHETVEDLNLDTYQEEYSLNIFTFSTQRIVVVNLFKRNPCYIQFCCLLICFLLKEDTDEIQLKGLRKLLKSILGQLKLSNEFILKFFHNVLLDKKNCFLSKMSPDCLEINLLNSFSLLELAIVKIGLLEDSIGKIPLTPALLYLRLKYMAEIGLHSDEFKIILNHLSDLHADDNAKELTTLGDIVNISKLANISSDFESCRVEALEECNAKRVPYTFNPHLSLLKNPKLKFKLTESFFITEIKLKITNDNSHEYFEKLSISLYRTDLGQRTLLNVPVNTTSCSNFIYIQTVLDYSKHLPFANEIHLCWSNLNTPISVTNPLENISIYGSKSVSSSQIKALENDDGLEKNLLLAFCLMLISESDPNNFDKQPLMNILSRLILSDDVNNLPISLAIHAYLRDKFQAALDIIRDKLKVSHRDYFNYLTVALILQFTNEIQAFFSYDEISNNLDTTFDREHETNRLISNIHNPINKKIRPIKNENELLFTVLNLSNISPMREIFQAKKSFDFFKTSLLKPIENQEETLSTLASKISKIISNSDAMARVKLVYFDKPRVPSAFTKNILLFYSNFNYDPLKLISALLSYSQEYESLPVHAREFHSKLVRLVISHLPFIFSHCLDFDQKITYILAFSKSFDEISSKEGQIFATKFLISLAIGIDMRRGCYEARVLEPLENFLLSTVHQGNINSQSYNMSILRLLSRTKSNKVYEEILTKMNTFYLSDVLKSDKSKGKWILDFLGHFNTPRKVNYQLHFIGKEKLAYSPGVYSRDHSISMKDKSLYSLDYLNDIIIVNETFEFVQASTDFQEKKHVINPDNLFNLRNTALFQKILKCYTEQFNKKISLKFIKTTLEFYQGNITDVFMECDLTPALWSVDNRLYDYIISRLARAIINDCQESYFQRFCSQQNSLAMFSLFCFIFFIQSEAYIRKFKSDFPEFHAVYFEAFLVLLSHGIISNMIKESPTICSIYQKIATRMSGSSNNFLILSLDSFEKFTKTSGLLDEDYKLISKANVYLIGLLNVLDLKKKFLNSNLTEPGFYCFTKLCQNLLIDEMNKNKTISSFLSKEENNLSHNSFPGFSKGTGYSIASQADASSHTNTSDNIAMEIEKRNLIFTVSLKCIKSGVEQSVLWNSGLSSDILLKEFITPLMEIITPVVLSESIDDMILRKRVYSHTLDIILGFTRSSRVSYILFSPLDDIPTNVEDFIDQKNLNKTFADFTEENEKTLAGILVRLEKFLDTFIISLKKINDKNCNNNESDCFDDKTRPVLQRRNSIRIKDLRAIHDYKPPRKFIKLETDQESLKEFCFTKDDIRLVLTGPSSKIANKTTNQSNVVKKFEDSTFSVVTKVHLQVKSLIESLETAYSQIIDFSQSIEGKADDRIIPKEREKKDENVQILYIKELKPIQCVYCEFLEAIPDNKETFKSLIHHNFARESLRQAGMKLEEPLLKTKIEFEGFVNSKVSIRLAKEISTMTKNLPLAWETGIFLCVDETRNDLIKALITGPADTPYENGCFEFDIFADSNYPQNPPKVFFVTTGGSTVRFNPNLYENGKVCLSLLNTWHSIPEERWQPSSSNLMQVLISIQSMIFVPEPYFNEPGYQIHRGTPFGDTASKSYNESIELDCMKWAILNQIENPPKAFTNVVMKHFKMKKMDVIGVVTRWIENSTSSHHKSTLQGYLNRFKDLIE